MRLKSIFRPVTVLFLFVIFPFVFSQNCSAILDPFNTLSATYLPDEYSSMFSQNNIAYWDPCDGNEEESGGECIAASGDKITWIGDSYSVESKDKIRSALPGVDLGTEDLSNAFSPYSNIQYSKHLDWISNSSRNDAAGGPSGINILQEIIDANKMRPYVVLALGTNDPVDESTTTSTLEKIASMVGNDTKVILTTAYTTNGTDYSGGNNAKKAFASTHDNFFVADWASVAKNEYYANNSTHPDANGGYDAWVQTIVDALPKSCDSGLLPGNNIPEKIWNWLYSWFKEKNISGVNVSAVISGIMGNFMSESGLNPFMVGSAGSYYGLWMKYGSFGGDELVKKVNEAVGNNHFKFYGWWEDENTADRVLKDNGVSEDSIDKAIDTELQILTRDSYWENEFIPALTDWGVADTPRGYSDLFLVTIERAVNGSDPIEDEAVRKHYGGFYQGAGIRRERADLFFNKYSGQAGSNNPSSKSKAESTNQETNCLCQTGSDSSNTNVSGGLTETQAQKIADYYNDDSTPLGSGYLAGRKDNCVAFSGWFVANLTDLTGGDTSNPTSGDGREVAQNLAAKYNLESGTTPKPWSVFSSTVFHGDNHTGVVVGVEGDQIITIEAEWWSENSGSLAHVKKDTIPSGSTTYTYLDGHIDNKKISEIIGESVSSGPSLNSSSSSSPKTSTTSSNTASSKVEWDSEGWITGGMDGYNKEPAANLGTSFNSGKPNKILLHYTQGTTNGLAAYGSTSKSVAAHFTIDLRKKEVFQHYPLSTPSGAVIDSDDVRDIVQIEIVGYGFYDNNPENPDQNSTCVIGGTDYTDSDYCFAKFGEQEWNYLAKLLVGISKWGDQNGTNIPLDTSVTWTGDVNSLRLSPGEFDSTTGIVAHMHAPDKGNHGDTGNIWPLVKAALDRLTCDPGNGGDSNISGAKNADKQSGEVGRLWFDDSDTDSMKTLLENYGELAYRTGQVYDVPWIGILVQGRYEDSNAVCGSNNFWGIACYDGLGPGEGHNYSNLGEGFIGYGETVHNGHYDNAIGEKDPTRYIQYLDEDGWNSGSYEGYKKSVEALTAFVESSEGQAIVSKFGAGNSCDPCPDPEGGNGDVLSAVQFIIDLANKNGSTYNSPGYRSLETFDQILSGELPVNVDCTGFASLVYRKTYGDEFTANDIFATCGIIGGANPSYVEVPRSEVSPGDIFAYDPGLLCGQNGHGGIVVEASNGVVTKIAETGGSEGRSGSNNNLGYSSGESSYSISRMNGPDGHFFRWKGSK